MTTVSLAEAQARLPEIIEQVAAGDEVVITKESGVAVRLVREPWRRPGPGLCKGMMTIVAEDDDHLDLFKEYMP